MQNFATTLAISSTLLVVMVAASPFPLPMPVPQLDSTEKCTQLELDSFFEDFDTCLNEAKAGLVQAALEGRDTNDATCQSITGSVKCIDEQGPVCYDTEQNRNVRNNFLTKQFELAHNKSSLGAEFVESCAILRNNEEKIVRLYTEANTCGYIEFEASFQEGRRCRDDAVAARDDNLEILDFLSDLESKRSVFVSAQCRFKESYYNCVNDSYKCYSDEKRDDGVAIVDESFADLQETIADIIDGFSFEKTCDNSIVDIRSGF